jgi:hypothetical protein
MIGFIVKLGLQYASISSTVSTGPGMNSLTVVCTVNGTLIQSNDRKEGRRTIRISRIALFKIQGTPGKITGKAYLRSKHQE